MKVKKLTLRWVPFVAHATKNLHITKIFFSMALSRYHVSHIKCRCNIKLEAKQDRSGYPALLLYPERNWIQSFFFYRISSRGGFKKLLNFLLFMVSVTIAKQVKLFFSGTGVGTDT